MDMQVRNEKYRINYLRDPDLHRVWRTVEVGRDGKPVTGSGSGSAGSGGATSDTRSDRDDESD